MNECPSYLASAAGVSPAAEFSLGVAQIVSPSNNSPQYKLEYEKKKPKIVGNYLLGKVIGQGNFGKVREATDMTTKHQVAVKILNTRRLRKLRNGEAHVQHEIDIMRRLTHKNVTKFIEVIRLEEKGKLYIVLELIVGGSLRTLMESAPDGRLSEDRCRWYFRQLMEGLSYLHSQGVIHRDIKPSNLMITRDGVLKFSDFGVAECVDDVSSDHAAMKNTNGTPSFLPPEVASGAPNINGKMSDIWAAGVTLFAIATGEMPFRGGNLYELLQNISAGDYKLPGFLSAELSELIAGLLEPNVAKRWTMQQICSHSWMQGGDVAAQAAYVHEIQPLERPAAAPVQIRRLSSLGGDVDESSRTSVAADARLSALQALPCTSSRCHIL